MNPHSQLYIEANAVIESMNMGDVLVFIVTVVACLGAAML